MAHLAASTKNIIAGVTPGVALAACYWLLALAPSVPSAIADIFSISPYVLFTAAAGLGWFFNRHRVVYFMIILTIAYGLTAHLNSPGVSESARSVGLASLALLFPINVFWISLQTNYRAVVSIRSASFLLIILFQLVTINWLYGIYPDVLNALVTFPENTALTMPAWLHLSVPAAIASIAVLTTMLIRLFRRFSVMEMGIFWTLVGCVLAFNSTGSNPDFSVYVSLAALILTVALLQTWYDLAYLDQLTGLPGRLALNEMVKNLKGDYAVAVVDVDFFKKCNDTYGHDVGDQILKLVATKLRQVTGGGTAFRFGGEEFVIVFPNKRIKDVFSHLATLRETIEESHMILRSKQRTTSKPNSPPQRKQPLRYINVTVSIGIAETNEENNTSSTVFKAADEALYRAKERGRNRLSL